MRGTGFKKNTIVISANKVGTYSEAAERSHIDQPLHIFLELFRLSVHCFSPYSPPPWQPFCSHYATNDKYVITFGSMTLSIA